MLTVQWLSIQVIGEQNVMISCSKGLVPEGMGLGPIYWYIIIYLPVKYIGDTHMHLIPYFQYVKIYIEMGLFFLSLFTCDNICNLSMIYICLKCV